MPLVAEQKREPSEVQGGLKMVLVDGDFEIFLGIGIALFGKK